MMEPLWVGILAPDDATDADLTLNNQESFFHGNPLRIDFAKPEQGPEFLEMRDGQYPNRSIGHPNTWLMPQDVVRNYSHPMHADFKRQHTKSYKSLWVAGISKSVSKEELEDQFKEFGKIQEYKLIRDRNTAYIEFARLEDAVEVLKIMNRKKIGGKHIHLDYLRSQPMKREQGPEFLEMRDGQYPNRSIGHPDTQLMPQDFVKNYFDPMHAGFKRQYVFLIG